MTEALGRTDALQLEAWPRGLRAGLGLSLGHDDNPEGLPDGGQSRGEHWQAATLWLQGRWQHGRQRWHAQAQGEWRRSDLTASHAWRSDTHALLAGWAFSVPGPGDASDLQGALDWLDETSRRPWAFGPGLQKPPSDLDKRQRTQLFIETGAPRRLGWEALLRHESLAQVDPGGSPQALRQTSALLGLRWGQTDAERSPVRLGAGLRFSRQDSEPSVTAAAATTQQVQRHDVIAALRWKFAPSLMLLGQIEAARERADSGLANTPTPRPDRHYQTGELALAWQPSVRWRWAIGRQKWQGELSRDALGAMDAQATALRESLSTGWTDSDLVAHVSSLALSWRPSEKWSGRAVWAEMQGHMREPSAQPSATEWGRLGRLSLDYQVGPRWLAACSIEFQERRSAEPAPSSIQRRLARCSLGWALGG